MMIEQDNGLYTGGPLDVWCILHNVKANTYHFAFRVERPMPGPIGNVEDLSFVRLKSKMHHTAGDATLEAAKDRLKDERKKIAVDDSNVWSDPMEWDGEPFVTVVANWKRAEAAACS
jgi:hypothetical protein